MAVGLILIIAVVGYFLIPPVVYATVGYAAGGTVEDKMIGQGSDSSGSPTTWYTVSVLLFNDDPVNGIHSGEALAYIVSKSDWEKIEWGDIVKIRTFPNAKAEITGIFPSLKPATWNPLYSNGISIDLTSNESTYRAGGKASVTVNVTWLPSISWNINLTLFKVPPFWVFMNGSTVFESQGDRTLQNVTLEPGKQWIFNFEYDLSDNQGRALPTGIYYVRAYLGYVTLEESTLTATTMIEIQS
jgi:hypothetical protein